MQLLRRIRRLGPYPSLFLIAAPLAIVEPLKLAAVVVLGKGHWLAGTTVMLCAYAISAFLIERLFRIVKPKLLTLSWFKWGWMKFVTIRNRIGRRLWNGANGAISIYQSMAHGKPSGIKPTPQKDTISGIVDCLDTIDDDYGPVIPRRGCYRPSRRVNTKPWSRNFFSKQ